MRRDAANQRPRKAPQRMKSDPSVALNRVRREGGRDGLKWVIACGAWKVRVTKSAEDRRRYSNRSFNLSVL